MQIQVVSKSGMDQQTGHGLFAVVFAAVLAVDACLYPSGYLFDRKVMRLHLHTCVSNEVWFLCFLFGDAEEKKEVMTVLCIKELLVYSNYRMPASFSNEMIQCGKCGKWAW